MQRISTVRQCSAKYKSLARILARILALDAVWQEGAEIVDKDRRMVDWTPLAATSVLDVHELLRRHSGGLLTMLRLEGMYL